MSELDLSTIAAGSISTPAAGAAAVFVNTAAPNTTLAFKNSTGTVFNFVSLDTADTLTNKTLTTPTLTTPVINGTITGTTVIPVLNGGTGVTTSTGTVNTVLSTAPTLTGVILAAGSTSVAPLTATIAGSAVLTSAAAGAVETDTAAFYTTVDTTNGRRYNDGWNYFRLTGSGTGITSIADFFGTNDGIPLVASGIYEIEWDCWFSQATAGTATWTITTATTALATLTAYYVGTPVAGIGAVGTPQTAGVNVTASSATALPVTGTEATGATHHFNVHAMLSAGAGASNTRLRLTMSAGTATPLINSFFRVRRMSGANTGAFVA